MKGTQIPTWFAIWAGWNTPQIEWFYWDHFAVTSKYIFPTYGNIHLNIHFSLLFKKDFYLFPPLKMEIGLKSNATVIRQVFSWGASRRCWGKRNLSVSFILRRASYYGVYDVLWHYMELSPLPSFQLPNHGPLNYFNTKSFIVWPWSLLMRKFVARMGEKKQEER